MTEPTYSVGIDIGSTTFKLVVLDERGELVFSSYKRHNTAILQTGYLIYKELYKALGQCRVKVVMTGSIAMGYSKQVGIRFAQEVIAAAEYVKRKHAEVRTFIDMGGEDSKMIFFEEGKIPDIRMNGSCAGGTGAFIDQTAALLEIETKELNTLAQTAENVYPIASRCGVFSKTDIQNLASRNVSRNDIAKSVFNAVAIQVVSSLARGNDILPKVFFCGGPFAFLSELKEAFVRLLNLKEEDVLMPERPELIPAWGSALIAMEEIAQSITLSDFVRLFRDHQQAKNQLQEHVGCLPALFASEEELEAWRQQKSVTFIPTIAWDQLESEECYLGVDSGSTTTKLVLLDKEGRIVFSDYSRNKGDSFKAFGEALARLKEEAEQHGKKIKLAGSAATGYGENLIKTAYNMHYGVVETMAHYLAARTIDPEVSFVLDIGGQDMKAIYIENKSITRLEINEACSSGCGSFIENFANILKYPVAEFAHISCLAHHPYDLGTRCTVFMNSKVKQAMQEGADVADIAAGFSYSVVKNCLYKVLKIKNISELGEHIVVQGGTFKNLSIVRALELMSGKSVYFSNVPELMGAYGAALYARDRHTDARLLSLADMIATRTSSVEMETCPGCENHCQVKKLVFSNGNTFFTGNNCEKIYSNKSDSFVKGVNQHREKLDLLFKRPIVPKEQARMRIGIPRALGIYENYPFWHELFTACGIQVVLSPPSTNKIYEKGIRSIMADNICFPAKVMHGHIYSLTEQKVDRIFYPYVVYEQKEDPNSRNSYNCPIVAGYSDVIKSSIDPEERFGLPVDAPVMSFNDEKLLRKSCQEYLLSIGVPKNLIKPAIDRAIQVQWSYLDTLHDRAVEIVEKARAEQRMVILLAGRPYHVDPLIQHKISDSVSDMGIDVITENITLHSDNAIYEQMHGVSQWAYPNRIYKAAHYVAESKDNIHMVQLTSFGCGPDSFILDEVKDILNRNGKNLTILKIDDVNNIGSLRLRIRSLVESLQFKSAEVNKRPRVTTKVFMPEDKRRTILAPYFAEGYSELLPAVFKGMGYKLVNLPLPTVESTEQGLRYANNEVCYPATIVTGSIITALKSGEYNLDDVAVAITQTGGQCRASNYIALIKNAMVAAEFEKVPVVSVAFGDDGSNEQPGFDLPWGKVIRKTLMMLMYCDCLGKLYYPAVAREKEKGVAKRLHAAYLRHAAQAIEQNRPAELFRILDHAVTDFANITVTNDNVPVMGVVGEIYLKYNAFSNRHILDWLAERHIEVVAPSMYNFFINSFVNNHINKKQHIKQLGMPLWLSDTLYKLVQLYTHKFDRICSRYRYYRPFSNLFKDAQSAEKIINLAANFGEGWLIPAEIASFAESGVNNVLSFQPFGCIANHVISKGIEKRVKKLYPKMNILSLDFDSGTSETNVFNRLHFIVK
jgi:predicted CoA-substrate-specific enzyme activase